MPVINPTKHTFDHFVTEKSNDEPVVIAFTASWCGPCKLLKPKLAKLANDWGFTLAMVDAGDEPELAALFGVRAVPTVITLEAGLSKGRFSGDRTEAALIEYFGELGLNQSPVRLEF
ncbi:thioredoxin family protein [Paraburkholderia sp.]|uniref:thioredoxin family protein n=1 Tax=Paraburkholderia sp. TaxID=1926495 RepID=UPI0039E3258E